MLELAQDSLSPAARSVRSAVEHGTQMLELDCHLTHDGHVVVSHDENLLRQTGHDVAVSSLGLQVSWTRPHQLSLSMQRFQSKIHPNTPSLLDRKNVSKRHGPQSLRYLNFMVKCWHGSDTKS